MTQTTTNSMTFIKRIASLGFLTCITGLISIGSMNIANAHEHHPGHHNHHKMMHKKHFCKHHPVKCAKMHHNHGNNHKYNQ